MMPSGCEAAVKSIQLDALHRIQVKGETDVVLVKLDQINAFNSIETNKIMETLTKICSPAFTNFMSYKLAEGNKVIYASPDNNKFEIVKTKGVTQGGNASSFIFNATQQSEFEKANIFDPVHGITMFLIHDDINLVGQMSKMGPFIDCLKIACQNMGTKIHERDKNDPQSISKCEIMPAHRMFEKECSQNPIQGLEVFAAKHSAKINANGIIIAGIPIGTDEFIIEHLNSIAENVKVDINILSQWKQGIINDPKIQISSQQAFNMLNLAIAPMFTHILRSVSPRLTNNIANDLHDHIVKNVFQILRVNDWVKKPDKLELNKMSRRMTLSKIEGGLGIINLRNISDAAFIGSKIDTSKITNNNKIISELQMSHQYLGSSIHKDLMESGGNLVKLINEEDNNNIYKNINSPALYSLDPSQITKAQHTLSQLIHKNTKSDILSEDFNESIEASDESGILTQHRTMNAEAKETHFHHLSHPLTSGFLRSTQTMSDNQFELACLLRIGAIVVEGNCHCQHCNNKNENIYINGSYALIHANHINQSRNPNHNRLQWTFAMAIKKFCCDIMYQTNPLISQSIELKNPNSKETLKKKYADAKITSSRWSMVIDYRIAAIFKPNITKNNPRTIFAIANGGEKDKLEELSQYLTTEDNFVAAAFDVFGVPSDGASRLISKLTDEAMICNPHLPRSQIISSFRQQISVAIQINNANTTIIMINNCNPNIPCNNNIILTNTGQTVKT